MGFILRTHGYLSTSKTHEKLWLFVLNTWDSYKNPWSLFILRPWCHGRLFILQAHNLIHDMIIGFYLEPINITYIILKKMEIII